MFEITFTSLTLISFMLLGLAQSKCHSVTAVNGVVTALCKDDNTGFDFEYQDREGRHSSTALATEALESIYADYRSGINNPDAPSVPRKSNELMGYWEECDKKYTEGVCADDHVINWVGSGEYFVERLSHMFRFVDRVRMQQEPRAICTRWARGGTICIQWTFTQGSYLHFATERIANFTWEYCQSRGYSTEIKAPSHDAGVSHSRIQYWCISDRSYGCVPNPTMTICSHPSHFTTKTGPGKSRWQTKSVHKGPNYTPPPKTWTPTFYHPHPSHQTPKPTKRRFDFSSLIHDELIVTAPANPRYFRF